MFLAPKFKIFFIYFSIAFLIFHINYFAQKERIVKIIDSNLFELGNGELIKLAGVDVPTLNHPDLELRNIASDAFKYAKRNLEKRSFNLTYPIYSTTDTNFSLVYIIREYPLLSRDFTEEYLRKGYGKYLVNTEQGDSLKYVTAEEEARNEKKGVWELSSKSDFILDQNFSEFVVMNEEWIDSVENHSASSAYWGNISDPSRVLLEVISAPLTGSLSAILGGAVLVGISGATGWDSFGYALIGGYIGYTVGSAAGVYFIAKNGNRDVTFGATLGYSFLGALTSIAIIRFINHDGILSGPFALSPLVLPGLFAIIYSNLIAPEKSQANVDFKPVSKDPLVNTGLTHKDYYNSSKLFEMEFLRIKF